MAAPREDEPSWAERRDAVASMIRFHAPDIVGVQEALPGMLDDLAPRLPDYEWVGTGRDAGDDEHCALFFHAERVRLPTHDTFWLSETPGKPGSRSWDAAYPRVATWAEVRGLAGAPPVYIFNTHFDHRSAQARRESARLLRDRVDALAGTPPVALIGDLNAPPDTPPYRLLTATEGPAPPFRDALSHTTLPHHGPVGTFNGFGGSVQSNGRIDYIFVRGPVAVRRHGTLTDRWDGHFPSDHCPVLAELHLPDTGEQ